MNISVMNVYFVAELFNRILYRFLGVLGQKMPAVHNFQQGYTFGIKRGTLSGTSCKGCIDVKPCSSERAEIKAFLTPKKLWFKQG